MVNKKNRKERSKNMNREKIYNEVLEDIKNLDIVLKESKDLSHEELANKLNANGYDKEENYIDLYFGDRLETTVLRKNNEWIQIKNNIQIWLSDENYCFVDYKELIAK